MNYIVKPSLEHIALVKTASTLWIQSDIRLLIKFNFSLVGADQFREWQKIENRVTNRVSQLPLPEVSKEKIIAFIKPIGLEILKWMEYHCIGYIQVDLPTDFSWKAQGTIDRKKTAEMLIKNKNLDICKRYKLACVYCLENEISVLWNEIPVIVRRSFSIRLPKKSSSQKFPEICVQDNQRDLESLWTYIKQRGYDRASSYYQHLFKCCVITGNQVAAEYFYEKLSVTETHDFLVRYARLEADGDVLYFLLTLMNKDQQIEVLERVPYKVLKVFLDWPLQSLFTDVANFMWDFLSEEDYDTLLNKIVDKIRDDCKICNYKILFINSLQQSPPRLKNYVIGEHANGFLLTHLYLNKDKENFKLLLRSITTKEKTALIYNDKMRSICQYWIFEGEWDLLRFLIDECLPSKNEMMQFKENFERHVMWNVSKDQSTREKWDELFILLNHPDIK